MQPADIFRDARTVFEQQRKLAERAAEQVDDERFFYAPAPESNSIAVIMKHVGGNLRSRWTDFLTTDGEKPDRDRESEFDAADMSRAEVLATWNTGWTHLFETLDQLRPEDATRTVTIRGEPNTVLHALLRSLAHTSHHCGQIVYRAKQLNGADWRTLSIPRQPRSR